MNSVEIDGSVVEENVSCNNETVEVETDINSVLNLIISRSGVQEKVHIKDIANVEKIIDVLVSSGPQELQVIADFDATLSCFHYEGKRCATSYGIIQDSKLTTPDLKLKGQALFDKYHTIEIDTSLSVEERASKMNEWYTKKHETYLDSGLKIKANDIADVVKDAHIFLRDGSHQFLTKLHNANVPTLVFSAGNGNSVEEVLKMNNVYYSSVKIIANFMEFDEATNKLISFSKPIIHPGNKNEAALHETHFHYFESLKARRNAILLGDNVGDANMATGMPNQNAILKIGFLNNNFDQHLEKFKEIFDIVLYDDQSLHFVAALLDLILKEPPSLTSN